MNHFVRMGFVPRGHDLALLVLRVSAGLSLFLKHGLEKITGFSQMAAHFPDPLHIGSRPSLAFALFSDAVCSLLLILGLGTRWAALVVAINTGVAFVLVHRAHFFGERNGELAWMYLAAAITLVIAGGGRFSVDGKS